MPANVPMVITQGEDWTTQIVWTDDSDEPLNVIHPCRMDIKSTTGQTILTLESIYEPEEGVIPGIALSSEIGLIQMHIPRDMTAGLLPGNYHYDLFVTTDDDTLYIGPQVSSLIYGAVTVGKRVTVLA